MIPLSKKVLATLAYYDVMDYLLTSFEIWKHLVTVNNKGEIKLVDIVTELKSEEIKKFASEHNGYYFLKGRKDLVRKRINRNKISEMKFRIIRRVAFWLRFVPFVRMVGVTGRLAMKNAGKESDLDVFIVLEKNRIFTGRTLVTAFIHLLGRRRHKDCVTDRVCLNFFVASDCLTVPLKDMFSASEYSFMVPLFGGEQFLAFQKANDWIGQFQENFKPDTLMNLKLAEDSRTAKDIRFIGEIIFSLPGIENLLGRWQIKRIKKDPRTNKPGSAVSANNSALIFLPEPQGPKVFEKFQDRLAELKI